MRTLTSNYGRFHDTTVLLLPGYYAGIGYYVLMGACGKAVVGTGELFDKRAKSVHRCSIADTNGLLRLTVPVGKPHGIPKARWTDVPLRDHGAWWHVHRVTLESAYGRTPFFEYYIDRFMPFLTPEVMESFPTIADLDMAIDTEIRKILLLETEVCYGAFPELKGEPSLSVVDQKAMPPAEMHKPYYQVRAGEQGFIPGMSVLDLIFNLGPEAPLYLSELIGTMRL